MGAFSEQMRNSQEKYKAEVLRIEEKGTFRGNAYAHILPVERWDQNLWEGIRNEAPRHFAANRIAWHVQRHNMLSSQIMCVNVFFPLRHYLDVLGKILSGYFTDLQQVIELDFEYVGPRNYFGERGGRGQNRTSSDVAVLWLDRAKTRRLLLLEFKFTEPSFGNCGQKDNLRRERCLNSSKVVSSPRRECYRSEVGRTYWDFVLSQSSPFRKDRLTAEKYCPFHYDFYQLMRNQLLAHCIESDPNSSASRADFGVIYHAGNQDLLDMPRSFGGERNPFVAWRKMLQNEDTFHAFTVQDLVKAVEPALPSALLPWRQYLKERYGL